MRRSSGIGREASRPRRPSTGSSHSAAFLVEAVILMAATMACMAIFASLFSRAALTARQTKEQTQAVALAQECAESFMADPTASTTPLQRDGLVAVSTITQQDTGSGVLYHDHIVVTANDTAEQVFELDSSSYVSGRSS